MATLTASQASDLFRTAPERYVDVRTAQVAVRSVGEGPDVLFVHGWPASGATFRALLPHLVEHVTCHVIDLPGAGDSRFDRTTTISIAEHARAVREVVTALGLRDVAVVGHDSGGLIARHALAGDARVRAWGLVDTEQPQGAHWRFSSFLAMRYVPGFEGLLRKMVSNKRFRRQRLVLGDCFADPKLLDGEFDEFFLQPLITDDERLWASGQFARNFDLTTLTALRALHPLITCPVALAWGADDPFFPLAWTERMVASFGGHVELTPIARGKLFVHEEFPEQVAHALLPTIG